MSAASICRNWKAAVTVLALAVLTGLQAYAHEIRPGLLDIQETQVGMYEVTWKVPVLDGATPVLIPRFPDNIILASQPSVESIPGARIEKASYQATDGTLVGGEIQIDGLSALQIDVLIQLSLADGSTHSAVVRPKAPFWRVPADDSVWTVFKSYTRLGGEHIFGGYDHLLFVLALVLLIPNRWSLFKAVTAFTLGHSITLALAALGVVHVPSGPTETVIAMSIVFLAAETVRSRNGPKSIAAQSPWIIAAGFGLIHGLGFAGALTEIGLPQNAIPMALIAFNVGVEIGQVVFIVAVLCMLAALRRTGIQWPKGSWGLVPYLIGTTAVFWTIERVSSLV